MINELQILFDRSLSHIRKQGSAARRGGAALCAYRTDDGKGCAAAPFILSYTKIMEGYIFLDIPRSLEANIDPLAWKHRGFINRLQLCHDRFSKDVYSINFLELYEEEMKKLAGDVGLNYAAPGALKL